jgi:hypothetical protein
MNNDKQKLTKEVNIGIKLKKTLSELTVELSREGYRDNEIADAYSEAITVSRKQITDILKVILLGIIIGISIYYSWPQLRWSDKPSLPGAIIFTGIFYSLYAIYAITAATKARVTPFTLFMYWVSSGTIDPTDEMDNSEMTLYENGKIIFGIGIITLMIPIWL